MYHRSFILTLFVALVFSSCNSQNAAVKNLGPDDFQKGISNSNVQIVDVRTPEEYNEKHIANAVNINVDGNNFDSKMGELNKSKPTYIYCLMGGRSKKAANWAAENGFSEVYNLDKGINSWMAANKPVVTASGGAPLAGMSFDDYLNHIKSSSKLVLTDFNAVWCGPCKLLKPAVLKTVKENSDKVELFDVDVDKNPAVSKTMNIQNIPLLILYKQGKEVWRNLGLTDEKTIEDKIKEFSK